MGSESETPTIQFARSADGTRIAYTSWGAGPAVVYVPTPYPNLGGLDDDLALGRNRRAVVARGLGQSGRVVLYDGRGVGLSERGVSDGALDAHVADLRAVLSAGDLGQAVLAVGRHATPIGLSAATLFPDDVAGLIVWDPALTGVPGRPATERLVAAGDFDVIADYYGRSLSMQYPSTAEAIATFRRAINAEDWRQLLRDMRATFDVRGLAPRVSCPVLLLRRSGQDVAPIDHRELADTLPNVEYQRILGPHEWDGTMESAIIRLGSEFSARIARARSPSPRPPVGSAPLTTREAEVLCLIADGRPNPAIAETLGITRGTVTRHTSNIFRKIGCANRVEATRWAILHGYAAAPTDRTRPHP